MGMDGLNNAVVPVFATLEQYVREITIANDGIVHQPSILSYAERSFSMIQFLDSLRVKFEKDRTGEYTVRKVHHLGPTCCRCPKAIT
jgi:succinate dehydrogenase/fumarate reductase flavoprotein subunit